LSISSTLTLASTIPESPSTVPESYVVYLSSRIFSTISMTKPSLVDSADTKTIDGDGATKARENSSSVSEITKNLDKGSRSTQKAADNLRSHKSDGSLKTSQRKTDGSRSTSSSSPKSNAESNPTSDSSSSSRPGATATTSKS
jgi:hypothetical protein